jgi:hypothetical protein
LRPKKPSCVPLVSRTKRPDVAPTVPSLITDIVPANVSVKTLRLKSISSWTSALMSISGSLVSPAASRRMPPESSMKNDCAWAIAVKCSADAAPALPAVSVQAPAAIDPLTVPAANLPVYRKRQVVASTRTALTGTAAPSPAFRPAAPEPESTSSVPSIDTGSTPLPVVGSNCTSSHVPFTAGVPNAGSAETLSGVVVSFGSVFFHPKTVPVVFAQACLT